MHAVACLPVAVCVCVRVCVCARPERLEAPRARLRADPVRQRDVRTQISLFLSPPPPQQESTGEIGLS